MSSSRRSPPVRRPAPAAAVVGGYPGLQRGRPFAEDAAGGVGLSGDGAVQLGTGAGQRRQRRDTLAIMKAASAERPGVRVLAEPHRGKAAAVRPACWRRPAGRSSSPTPISRRPCRPSRRCAAAHGRGRRGRPRHRLARGAGRAPRWRADLSPPDGARLQHAGALAGGAGLQGTQCGFKLFTRAAGQDLFRRMLLYGDDAPVVRGPMVTAFDVELLFLARKRGYASSSGRSNGGTCRAARSTPRATPSAWPATSSACGSTICAGRTSSELSVVSRQTSVISPGLLSEGRDARVYLCSVTGNRRR